MQFFSSDKRLQEFFFKITHPLPQELNGRPLSTNKYSQYLIFRNNNTT